MVALLGKEWVSAGIRDLGPKAGQRAYVNRARKVSLSNARVSHGRTGELTAFQACLIVGALGALRGGVRALQRRSNVTDEACR